VEAQGCAGKLLPGNPVWHVSPVEPARRVWSVHMKVLDGFSTSNVGAFSSTNFDYLDRPSIHESMLL
jgi:hypothetical protein